MKSTRSHSSLVLIFFLVFKHEDLYYVIIISLLIGERLACGYLPYLSLPSYCTLKYELQGRALNIHRVTVT